jgi:hypothetical protein
MAANAKIFAETYARMRDEDIQRLALDPGSLLPEAREVLRTEMKRRQMQTSSMDSPGQLFPQKSAQPQDQSRIFRRQMVLFFVFEAFVIAFIAYTLPATDYFGVSKMLEFDLKACTFLSTIMGGLIATRPLPRKTKILMCLAICVPILLLILCLAAY